MQCAQRYKLVDIIRQAFELVFAHDEILQRRHLIAHGIAELLDLIARKNHRFDAVHVVEIFACCTIAIFRKSAGRGHAS